MAQHAMLWPFLNHVTGLMAEKLARTTAISYPAAHALISLQLSVHHCAVPQADKYSNILKGVPAKKGLKIAHVPPPPVSMLSQAPWEGPAAPPPAAGSSGDGPGSLAAAAVGAVLKPRVTSAERAKWVGQKDFDALGNKPRSAVAKPGCSDAANASLHDRYYEESD